MLEAEREFAIEIADEVIFNNSIYLLYININDLLIKLKF
jgi:hypothetical protein